LVFERRARNLKNPEETGEHSFAHKILAGTAVLDEAERKAEYKAALLKLHGAGPQFVIAHLNSPEVQLKRPLL
jgi:hypothetical protein